MESYEVVVVGSGPAGLNCAQHLAEAGKKVLLLEQNAIIGPKICAGGLTGLDLEYLGLPEELLDRMFNEITFHSPLQRRIVNFSKPIVYTVDREKLGQWQLEKLKKTSAVVRTKARVVKIEKDYLVVNGLEKIGFNFLVGADGSASFVRRFLGLKSEDMGIAIQYIIPGNNYDKIELFFDSRLFKSWYAWIFPHKNYVSIGTGGDPREITSGKLRENFEVWLKQKNINVAGLEIQGCPINYGFKGYKFANIFLAGDAAGFASGLTGEGIYQALISGEEIAKSIIDPNYSSSKIKEIIKKKITHNKIIKILHRSGLFRQIEFELFVFMLKSHWFIKKAVKVIA